MTKPAPPTNRFAATPVTTFDDLGFRVAEYASVSAAAQAITKGGHAGSISQSIYSGISVHGVRCAFSHEAPERLKPHHRMVAIFNAKGAIVDYGRIFDVFTRLGFGRGAPHAIDRGTPYRGFTLRRVTMDMAKTLHDLESQRIAA